MNTSNILKLFILSLVMGTFFSCQKEEQELTPKDPTINGKWHLVTNSTIVSETTTDSILYVNSVHFDRGETTFSFFRNGTLVIGTDNSTNSTKDTFNFYQVPGKILVLDPETNEQVQAYDISNLGFQILTLDGFMETEDVKISYKLDFKR